MGVVCKVCGGRGKFNFIVTEWSEPKGDGYAITTKPLELPCKRCNGRGGNGSC